MTAVSYFIGPEQYVQRKFQLNDGFSVPFASFRPNALWVGIQLAYCDLGFFSGFNGFRAADHFIFYDAWLVETPGLACRSIMPRCGSVLEAIGR